MTTSHITDYPARDVAREAYLAYLSRVGANDKVKLGEAVPPKDLGAFTSKAAMAKSLRDSI